MASARLSATGMLPHFLSDAGRRRRRRPEDAERLSADRRDALLPFLTTVESPAAARRRRWRERRGPRTVVSLTLLLAAVWLLFR